MIVLLAKIAAVLGSLLTAFIFFGDQIKEALMWFVCWMTNKSLELLIILSEMALELWPDLEIVDFNLVSSYLWYTNHWFPVDQLLASIVAYWGFFMAWRIIKFVINMVPFVNL